MGGSPSFGCTECVVLGVTCRHGFCAEWWSVWSEVITAGFRLVDTAVYQQDWFLYVSGGHAAGGNPLLVKCP